MAQQLPVALLRLRSKLLPGQQTISTNLLASAVSTTRSNWQEFGAWDVSSSGTALSSRSCSTSASSSSEQPAGGSDQAPFTYPSRDVEYEGSFKTAHKRLKQASLLNTLVSCSASPLILLYAEMGTIGRISLATTLAGFGLATTGALHWFTKPYVHELRYTGSTGEIEIKKINLFAMQRTMKFHISEVTFPTVLNPAVTFMARGAPYYIEKNIFPDEELLAFLSPEDPAMANQPKGQDDDDD